MQPKTDILMSIYFKTNSADLIRCLDSLAAQRSDYNKLVLVFDGPVAHETSDIVDKYANACKIFTVELLHNSGIAVALNKGLEFCTSTYICRQDCDDVSLKGRFKRQVDFMELNQDLAASSCSIVYVDSLNDDVLFCRTCPSEPSSLRRFSKYNSPLNHGSCIFRRKMLIEVNGYPDFRRSQDQAFGKNL